MFLSGFLNIFLLQIVNSMNFCGTIHRGEDNKNARNHHAAQAPANNLQRLVVTIALQWRNGYGRRAS